MQAAVVAVTIFHHTSVYQAQFYSIARYYCWCECGINCKDITYSGLVELEYNPAYKYS